MPEPIYDGWYPTPKRVKYIPLSGEMETMVDEESFEYLNQWKWHDCHGYATRRRLGKRIYMHRVVLNTPEDKFTDHINGDKLDNRIANLRPCTQTQNKINAGLRSDNTSGFRGVGYSKDKKKWRAEIVVDGKYVFLGYYSCPFSAALVYDTAATKNFGEFAHLNISNPTRPE